MRPRLWPPPAADGVAAQAEPTVNGMHRDEPAPAQQAQREEARSRAYSIARDATLPFLCAYHGLLEGLVVAVHAWAEQGRPCCSRYVAKVRHPSLVRPLCVQCMPSAHPCFACSVHAARTADPPLHGNVTGALDLPAALNAPEEARLPLLVATPSRPHFPQACGLVADCVSSYVNGIVRHFLDDLLLPLLARYPRFLDAAGELSVQRGTTARSWAECCTESCSLPGPARPPAHPPITLRL